MIRVADTGIGIAKEDQETIFEEFRQVSEGYNRHFEGAGLGLTIAKKFTEKWAEVSLWKVKLEKDQCLLLYFL